MVRLLSVLFILIGTGVASAATWKVQIENPVGSKPREMALEDIEKKDFFETNGFSCSITKINKTKDADSETQQRYFVCKVGDRAVGTYVACSKVGGAYKFSNSSQGILLLFSKEMKAMLKLECEG